MQLLHLHMCRECVLQVCLEHEWCTNLFILLLLKFHLLGAGLSPPGPHISGPGPAGDRRLQEETASVCLQQPPGDKPPTRNYWDEDRLCSPLSRQQRAEAKPGQSLPAHYHWDTGQHQWKSFSLGMKYFQFSLWHFVTESETLLQFCVMGKNILLSFSWKHFLKLPQTTQHMICFMIPDSVTHVVKL